MLGRGGERGEIREVITLEELGASLDVLRRLEAGERGERGQKINEAYPSTDPSSREASSRRSDQKRDPNLVVIEIETVIPAAMLLFFTLNREDFSFVIHLDRQPRTSRRREAQTGSRARSGSRSERTLDAVEHSRTLMEWWPFLIFHRGGLRIKVINNTCSRSSSP